VEPGVARARTTELLSIFAAALGIRLFALWASVDTPAAGDEADYFARAVRGVLGRPDPDPAGRAPGVLYWYAGLFRLLPASAVGAKLGNVLLGAATVFPAYSIGRRFGGLRVALWSATGVALYPTFIAFSHYLWAEPLYIFLMASGVALLVWDMERPHPAFLLAAGVVLGLSALTKQTGVLFPVLAVGYGLWRDLRSGTRARALVRAACLLGAFALTLLPWVLHINEPAAPFALVTRTSGMNLYVGNEPMGEGFAMQRYPTLGRTRLETEAAATALATAQIRERLPLWPLEKVAKQVPRFFTPNSFAVRRLLSPVGDPGQWGYRFRWDFANHPPPRVVLAAVVVAAYVATLVFGLAGLLLARRSDLSILFGLYVASLILPSIVTFSMSRFRLPAMLFFLLGAASLGVHGPAEWGRASPRRRAGVVSLVVLMLGMLASGYASVLTATGR